MRTCAQSVVAGRMNPAELQPAMIEKKAPRVAGQGRITWKPRHHAPGGAGHYAGRLRQKSARAEGAADRDSAADRAASARRGRLSGDDGEPDFCGFALGRDIRAFE